MTDKDIQQAVLREFEWAPQIRSTEIGVAVKDGIVTLAGSVDSYTKRYDAERAAKRVAGVKAVVNDLEVHLPSSSERTDEDIARAAVRALESHTSVPRDRIKVTVHDGRITLEGDVEWQYQRQAAVGGGTITIPGEVHGGVRAAGGNLTITGRIDEDVVASGGMVDMGSTARIGRDVLLGTGSATIASQIGRNIIAGSGNLTLSGSVGGDVRADVGTLRLTEQATVAGDLRYTSEQEATIAPGATVRGQVARSVPAADRSRSPLGWVGSLALRWLRTLVGLFVLGLLLVLLFPEFSRSAVRTLGSAPWESLGLGVVLLIGVPIVAVIVLIVGLFVGGWWLALIALALYGIVLALGYIIAGLRLGRWVLAWVSRHQGHQILALLVGLALLTLLGLVPLIGFAVALMAMLFGVGALISALARTRQMPATPAV